MVQLMLAFFLVVTVAGCSSLDPQQTGTTPVSHELFDELLAKYVGDDGMVDYEAFRSERGKLQEYLELLTSNPPNDETWTSGDKLAYWINVYNAFTIDLILEYYPVASIKDIGSSIQVPFVNTPWDLKLIEIDGEKYDLNNVEHNILRKVFDEPRIHFAINCASLSCPKLRREAYKGELIDRQLQEQAMDFMNDPFRNEVTSQSAELSKLFKWWQADFTRHGTLREYINRFALEPLDEGGEIDYKEYDWSLNDTK